MCHGANSSVDTPRASISGWLLQLQTLRCDWCVTQRVVFVDGSVIFIACELLSSVWLFAVTAFANPVKPCRGGGGRAVMIYTGVIPRRRTCGNTLFAPRLLFCINHRPLLMARMHLRARVPLYRRMTAAERYARATGMTPEMLSKLVSNPELMVLMQNSKLQEVMKKVRHVSTNLTAGHS